MHGCSWGASCAPPPKPKENTTCGSHTTCSDCALSSHTCHWCDHDNACHAVGSPYGCVTGVDCYSNDRCRRQEPEPFHRFIIFDIPKTAIILTIVVASLIIACLSCCRYCFFNVKGAYDDLATISMAASRPPSVIGGTFAGGPSQGFYTTLETYAEEESEEDYADSVRPADEETPLAPVDAESAVVPSTNEPSDETEQRRELESDPDDLLNMTSGSQLTTPLIPPSARSFNGIPGMDEPPHMKTLYRMCSCIYYLCILVVVSLVFGIFTFFPKPPVYNVCNDAVAWTQIFESLVLMKLDASFEILVSVSNPNHVTVVLDKATGSFAYEGKDIGTYEMPSATAEAMAITDMMLIAKVTPDRYQAFQLAHAYFNGNLVLTADFNAKLRAPALFGVSYEVHMKDIDVYVNELGPRDLCHCPSWDDKPTIHTSPVAFFN